MTQGDLFAERTLLRQPPSIDGATYDAAKDGKRLGEQLLAVRELMLDGEWRTLRAISEVVGAPEASVSARVRDLRKPKFGGHRVERRRVQGGLFEYRVAGRAA